MDIIERAKLIEHTCSEDSYNSIQVIKKLFGKLTNKEVLILVKLLPNEKHDDLFNSPDKITRPILNIDLGSQCNLRCEYCYARQEGKNIHKEKMDKDVYKYIPKFIDSHFNECKNLKINFLGTGEPFLKPDKLYDVINYINSNCNDKVISFWSCTNGTLNINETLNLLDNLDFRLGVSLEASEELQNKLRSSKMYEETGTFDIVAKNINSILNDENLSNRVKDIWGLMVVHRETENLMEALNLFLKIGIKRVQMKPVRDSNSEDLDSHLINIYEKYVLDLSDDIKSNNFERIKMILNDTDYLGKFLLRILLGEATPKRCGAGSMMVSISSDGTIYPCDSMIGMKEMALGNIKSGIENFEIIDDISNLSINNNKECLKCWAKEICGGMCFYLNKISENSQKSECIFKKHLISLAISLAIEILENSKAKEEILRFAKTMRRIRRNTP